MRSRRLVLIVEDEAAIATAMQYHLEREGHETIVAGDGAEGLDLARRTDPDLVILDLMLPSMSGFDVLRTLRTTSLTPVIIVSARDAEADVVAGLELGADDYVSKPFSMRELMSRVGANLRRLDHNSDESADDVLVAGPIRVDAAKHVVTVDGEEVAFRPKEFSLLEALMRRKGRLVSRDDLISEVWGFDYFGDTKTLDVHVKRIRAKIEPEPKRPRYLVTVRGMGYKFVEDE